MYNDGCSLADRSGGELSVCSHGAITVTTHLGKVNSVSVIAAIVSFHEVGRFIVEGNGLVGSIWHIEVMIPGHWNRNVVGGDTIVGDEGIAGVVSGKFNRLVVDGIHRGNDRLAIVLDDGFGWADSGGSELGVSAWSDFNASTGHVKLVTMTRVHLVVGGVIVDGSMDVVIVMMVIIGGHGLVVVIIVMIIVGRGSVWVVMLIVVLRRGRGVGNKIVGSDTIVGDENAASVVAGKLNRVGVDFAHRSDNRLTVHLNDSLVGVDGGGSELGVSSWSNGGVSSSYVQFITMGRVHVVVRDVVGVAVVIGNVVGVAVVIGNVVGVAVVIDVIVDVVVVIVDVVVAVVIAGESVAVVKFPVFATEDLGAGGDHVGSESELLAVKDEGISVINELVLSGGTRILQMLNSLLGFIDLRSRSSCYVVVDVLLVRRDPMGMLGVG